MTDTPIRFEVWSPSLEAAPRRSRLYSLAPIGIGTPEVESLSSYLNRLAQAHCVTVCALMTHEVVPHLRAQAGASAQRAVPPSRGGPRGLGHRLARQIYGLGRTAATWVDVLTALTGRRDLRFLTLLAWRDVLPNRHLFARLVRWCPACFEAWATTGHPLYEPLLWKLKPLTVCVRHQQLLQSRCHVCQQQPATFSGRSRPGYCARCGAWLGSAGRGDLPPDERLGAEAWPWQRWVVTALGQLLQAAPHLERAPPAATVARAITAYQSPRATPDSTTLTAVLGSTHRRFGKWARGESRMQIDLLLLFCFHAGISLVQFLTEPTLAFGAPPEVVVPPPLIHVSATAGRSPPGVNRDALRHALEEALTSASLPVSLGAVAKRVQVAARTLLHYEPELCQRLVQRRAVARVQRRDRMRRLLEQAVQEDPPPWMVHVCQRSAIPPSMAWYYFPDLCHQIAARATSDRQRQFVALQDALECALRDETPPPTLDMVAARLGRGANGLRRHFPVLCCQITARHRAYQYTAFLQRRHALFEEIHAITLALHVQGLFPSINRVTAQLSRPRNIGSDAATVAELRRIRHALGWKN